LSLFRCLALWSGGRVAAGPVVQVAVEIWGVPASREPVKERLLGGRDQILDRLGYRVTVMAGEASELRLGLNADEELDALLGAVEAEMTLAVALLLLGRGQCHGGSRLRCNNWWHVGYTVTNDEASLADCGARRLLCVVAHAYRPAGAEVFNLPDPAGPAPEE